MTSAVSCVIPTHNRAGYLELALRSVAEQTSPPLEIVVVSDTDDEATRTVCAAFGTTSSIPLRYVYYSEAPGGASESRNRGAAATTGDLIAFLDDDDLWAPTYLEKATESLAGRRVDMVVTWITMFKGDLTKTGPAIVEGLVAADVVAVNGGTTGSNMVVTRQSFDAVTGFDPGLRMKNDTDFFYRFLKQGHSYGVVGERLVLQRKHDSGQLTGHSAARADFTARYLEKHRADLTAADRRKLAFVIHRIRRHTETSTLSRVYHSALTLTNYSVRQFRIDRSNRDDKEFFAVPSLDEPTSGKKPGEEK